MIRHATNPVSPYHAAICSFELESGWEGHEAAKPGQAITCPQCRAVITWAKGVKNFREPPADVTDATIRAFLD